jgi:hypothetical protein
MADESTLTVVHSYGDDEDTTMPNFGVSDLAIDVATLKPAWKKVSVATAEQVLDLDGITAAGAMLIGVNRDTVNYLEIRSGTGAANDIVKVLAGEPCCFRFGSDITAPYIIANTAAVQFEYRLIPL